MNLRDQARRLCSGTGLHCQSVTFTANVTSQSGTVPNGETVTFTSEGTTLGTALTSGGVATLSTSTLTAGRHTIRASYPGNSTFASSAATLTQTVNKYSTTTSLASSLNPSSYQRSITFTAVVASAGPATPTGSVTFRNGASSLKTVTLVSGVATLAIYNLPVGSDSITATYGGDAASATSASIAVQQVVNPAGTAVNLTSSQNPSLFSRKVTFTATVTLTAPNSTGVPTTGSVKIMAGTTLLGTASLNGSSIIRISTTSLPRGMSTITATYTDTSNSNYTSSTTSLVQTVN